MKKQQKIEQFAKELKESNKRMEKINRNNAIRNVLGKFI
jgi:hypothetical protein